MYDILGHNMIYVSIDNLQLRNELEQKFLALKVKYKILPSIDKLQVLNEVFQNMPKALIVENNVSKDYFLIFQEMLKQLSFKTFVLMIESSDCSNVVSTIDKKNFKYEWEDFQKLSLQRLCTNSAEEILYVLNEARVFDKYFRKFLFNKLIPYYNAKVIETLLERHKSIGIITIDISHFKEIEIEYGNEIASIIKDIFIKILLQSRGHQGCLRSSDMLFKHSPSSNLYYIFLSRSRITGLLPLPGMMEKIADRLSIYLYNALYKELMMPTKDKMISRFVKDVPEIVIGYNSLLYNPCLNSHDSIENAINKSLQNSQIQLKRFKNQHKELIQTIIQGNNLLRPNFQCIFDLTRLTKDMVDEVNTNLSIKPIKDLVFAVESLIRVNLVNIKKLFKNDKTLIDVKFLNPDSLFRMSKKYNLALELDQACLRHALNYSKHLNYFIMLNILPRNLYLIDILANILPLHSRLILEVSESEAINNFDLMMKSKNKLIDMKIQIAVDDFGKGFSGLDRIINLQPNFIKFDRSIVMNVDKDPIKQSYIKGVVSAAKMLNTLLIAEGIERWEEAQFLQDVGVNYIQGFLLHKPQTIEALMQDLQINLPDFIAA